MEARIKECIAKALWHAMIAVAGAYELRNHKTTASKVLACGLIAFHVDAAFADFWDKPTTLQRILGRILP